MSSLLPSGIRSTSDLTYKDVLRSVKLMNQFCENNGARFFFDTSDCDVYVIGHRRLNDLYGWIVPNGEADDFEAGWKAMTDRVDGEYGAQWYHAIVWDDRDGAAVPVIVG